MLRQNFNTNNLKFLQFDIPLMALTATATKCVQEDIINCLCMSKEAEIVLTSFFRSNLRFSVSSLFGVAFREFPLRLILWAFSTDLIFI